MAAPRVCALAAAFAAFGSAAGFQCASDMPAMDIAKGVDMAGKVVAMTGGDSGIGYNTALAVASTKATVIILSYDAEGSGREAAANVTRITGNDKVSVLPIDLSSLDSVRACAKAILAAHPRVDALLCDAGTGGPTTHLTADGFERTFEVNYLGHFLLVELLLPSLRASGDGRVVSVSSGAAFAPCDHPQPAPLPALTGSGGAGSGSCVSMDLLQNGTNYNVLDQIARTPIPNASNYGFTKFLQVYHMRELARREAARGSGVRAFAIRPGLVVTPLMEGGWTPEAIKAFCTDGGGAGYPGGVCPLPATAGAGSPTYLLTAADLPPEYNGEFFWMCEPHDPPAWTPSAPRKLYDQSLKWIGA